MSSENGERCLAVYIDFENIALGFKGKRGKFDIQRVLDRLVEKGKIIVKRAYADWNSYSDYVRELHAAGVELIEIPRRVMTGKNSADIRLVVDAMDLSYSKPHVDTFVIVSGDSDFSPLVGKLKENGKHVIGMGMEESTSELLRDNCDEFIYYEDLKPVTPPRPAAEAIEKLPPEKRKAFRLLVDTVAGLMREGKENIHSSMVKDTMKRKKPSFNEGYYGYRTFSEFLEAAEKEGLVTLDTDPKSGTYAVTGLAGETTTRLQRKQGKPGRSAAKTKSAPGRSSRGKGS